MGADQDLECWPPGESWRIENGANFIHRRVEPLTFDHWLIQEVKAIRAVLDADSADAALKAAHDLGILHEQANRHAIDLESVTKARRQVQHALEAGEVGAASTKARAEGWQIIAKGKAALIWRDAPDKPVTEVAQSVARWMQKNGVRSARNQPPSQRRIREVVGPLRPARKKSGDSR